MTDGVLAALVAEADPARLGLLLHGSRGAAPHGRTPTTT